MGFSVSIAVWSPRLVGRGFTVRFSTWGRLWNLHCHFLPPDGQMFLKEIGVVLSRYFADTSGFKIFFRICLENSPFCPAV